MITKNVALGLNAKYFLHNYAAQLNPTNSIHSEIKNKNSYAFSVGIRFILNVEGKLPL